MNKQEFYRLEEPRFEQYEFAFYEVADDTEYGDFPKCPKCKSPLGMRRWLPPRRVYLEQARRIGDFIFGAGGGDMLVTERFKSSFEKLNLKGIKEFNSVEVLSIKPKTITRNIPVLFEAVIAIRQSKVLYEKMGVIWVIRRLFLMRVLPWIVIFFMPLISQDRFYYLKKHLNLSMSRNLRMLL